MNYSNSDLFGKDLVCGTITSDLTTAITCRYNGRIFYFCSDYCLGKFSKNPRHYLARRRHRKLPPRMKLSINRIRGFHP